MFSFPNDCMSLIASESINSVCGLWRDLVSGGQAVLTNSIGIKGADLDKRLQFRYQ